MPPNIPTSLPSDFFRGLRNIFNGALANRINAALGQINDQTRVETLTDLPAPVNSVITLPAGRYKIIGVVNIGANKITISGNVRIDGDHVEHSSIVSSNPDEAILVSGSMSLHMRDITVSNSVGDGLNSTGSGALTLDVLRITATAAGKSGILAPSGGSNTVTMRGCKVRGDLYGARFGSGGLRLRTIASEFRGGIGSAGNRAIYIDDDAVLLSAMFTDCRFRDGGDFALLVSSSTTFTVPAHFIGCSADGFGTAGLDTGGEAIGSNLTVISTNDFV